MRLCLVLLAAIACLQEITWGQESATIPLAEGFSIPVGVDGAKKYYKARGFRQNGHLGEDWNGEGGGDTDLGDPVYATAAGIVVFAQDYKLGWGNVVILRHAYAEGGVTQFVDSLYGHLDRITVVQGQQVKRLQQVGTIGNNRGMYDAHLHFEMRKNLQIGMHRSSFARDFSNYWDPTSFIVARAALASGGRLVTVVINTFAATPPSAAYASAVEEGFRLATPPQPARKPGIPEKSSSSPRGPFKVERYGDMK